MQITQHGEHLLLLPERAVYWAARKTLWLADPHFGKPTHFNKTGIYVPPQLTDADLFRLGSLLDSLEVECLVFLGDLFHSKYNAEWEKFGGWLQLQDLKERHLVLGNHDILHPAYYQKYGLTVHAERFDDGPFTYVHEYVKGMEETVPGYIVSGHVHPGVYIAGKARQGARVPCFYFGSTHAILPAFGRFTGLYLLERETPNDNFYVIADNQIVAV